MMNKNRRKIAAIFMAAILFSINQADFKSYAADSPELNAGTENVSIDANQEKTESASTDEAQENAENVQNDSGQEDDGQAEQEDEEEEEEDADVKKSAPVGLVKKNGSWYFYQKNGKVLKNSLKAVTVNGTKYYYYFGKNGRALIGKFKTINSKRYYFGKNGRAVTGFYNVNGKRFYFDKKGVAENGWFSSGGHGYYAKNGVLYANRIAGSKKEGYDYVDEKGIRVKDAVVRKAVQCVCSITEENWSKEKKLRACFDYIVLQCEYERHLDPEDISKMPEYATYMFDNKKGNCYRGASALAYMAKVLGYSARVGVGAESTHMDDSPLSVHGWTEIKQDNNWLMYDTSMQRRNTDNLYGILRANYPYRLQVDNTYLLRIKNGTVSWTVG